MRRTTVARQSKSKRRCGTKPNSELPELVFWIDRSIGRHIVPAALRKTGRQVKHHDDEFPENAEDVDWLPIVGSRGWIIITQDHRIRTRPNERRAYQAAGARVFIVTASGLTGRELAELLVTKLRRIEEFVQNQPPGPFMARINRSEIVLYDVTTD
ncbi:MAG: hypothetical protein ACJ79H_22305 [Myxococcales bacterium]